MIAKEALGVGREEVCSVRAQHRAADTIDRDMASAGECAVSCKVGAKETLHFLSAKSNPQADRSALSFPEFYYSTMFLRTAATMEFYLSKKEYVILQLMAITWSSYQIWDTFVNLNEKYPATRRLSARVWRRLMGENGEANV